MSVLVVGGANYDLIASPERLPAEGETLVATTFHAAPGGKAANQAAAAARWGAVTTFVGCVGDDDFGRHAVADLREAGVDVQYVEMDEEGTGLGLVFMDPEGRYATTVAPRANATLNAEIIDALPATVFEASTLLTMALDAPPGALEAACPRVRAAGGAILVNAAPADRLTPRLNREADILVCNEHEAGEVLGVVVASVHGAEQCAERLGEGRRTVVITLGSNGVVAWSPAAGVVRIPGIKVDAIDTLGAGDVFVGVLAAELDADHDLAAALEAANHAAAASVLQRGARFPLGTPQAVSEMLSSPQRKPNPRRSQEELA